MTQQDEDRIALQCLEAFDCGEYQDRVDMLRGFLASIRTESEPVAWVNTKYVICMPHCDASVYSSPAYQEGELAPLFATPPGAPTESPGGWQLVPKEMTEGMIKAWISGTTFRSAYRSMLAAAPKVDKS